MKEEALIALLITQAFAIMLMLGKYVLSTFSKKHEKQEEQQEKLNSSITTVTIAINKLEIQIEYLNKAIMSIPKMQKDIDEAHNKIRSFSGAPSRS